MQLVIGTINIQPIAKYPVVAIGNFDGLHLGHQALLSTAVARAGKQAGTAVALTFEPHPSHILFPERGIKLLSSFQEKTRKIESMGIHTTLVADFNRSFSEQSPDEFAQILLHQKIGAREILIGQGFKFGKDRAGEVAHLIQLGKRLGFSVHIQEPVVIDGEIVSSSRIRERLREGDVRGAARMLGRPYTLEGRVIHGDHMGKALGCPTANLRLPNELVPKEGIYAVRVTVLKTEGSLTRDGIVYIGTKPTFSPREIQIEVNLFDYADDLYGRHLWVTFVDWVRGDEKFSNSEALVKQMGEDIHKAKTLLGTRAEKSFP